MSSCLAVDRGMRNGGGGSLAIGLEKCGFFHPLHRMGICASEPKVLIWLHEC